MITFENPIRAHRTAKGWSLQKLADACGTSKSQIDKLERGQRRLTVEWIARLSKALGCDARELLPSNALAATGRAELLPIKACRPTAKGFTTGPAIDGVPRPYFLEKTHEAYALYMPDDSMKPMFRPGQILFVNPHRPPAEGIGVVVFKRDDTILVAAFKGHKNNRLSLHLFGKKEKSFFIKDSDVFALHAIVGTTEG